MNSNGPRPTWSKCCPFCVSTALVFDHAAITCAACGAKIGPPSRRDIPTHVTARCHPLWEDDNRLDDGTWDRYSRRGRLEESLRALDRELDAAAKTNVDRIQELAELIRAIREDLRRHGEGGDLAGKKPKKGPADPCAVVAMRPTWVQILCSLSIELDNARLRRGGRADEITRPRVSREEPFAGYGHAINAAFGGAAGAPLGGGSGSTIPSSPAKHAIPQGVRFGEICVKPSHGGTEHVRGEDAAIARVDLENAIAAARVGVRTSSVGGRVVRDPGRPIDAASLELLRLVDCGEIFPKAKTTKKGGVVTVSRDAVEPVHPRDAVRKVRDQGVEGAAQTEHQARLSLRDTRRAIRIQLEDRGLIPQPVRRIRAAPAPRVVVAPLTMEDS